MSVPLPPPDSILWDDPSLCTYSTCPIPDFGLLDYRPNLASNLIFVTLFGIGFVINTFLAIRYRIWGFLLAMGGACAMEVVGYAGRVMLWQDVFDMNNFTIYLVGCTIGPAFFSAGIYICLSRIMVIYGLPICRLNPRWITMLFIGGDVLSLILQATGGAIASTTDVESTQQIGVNIMIAGLCTQVASTAGFTIICGVIAYFVHKNRPQRDPSTYQLRKSSKFRFFLIAIVASTLLILERCIFRVAELAGGFGGSLANNQVLFLVLDGAAMSIVLILLTAAHPGLIIGTNIWHLGAFRRLPKGKQQRMLWLSREKDENAGSEGIRN